MKKSKITSAIFEDELLSSTASLSPDFSLNPGLSELTPPAIVNPHHPTFT